MPGRDVDYPVRVRFIDADRLGLPWELRLTASDVLAVIEVLTAAEHARGTQLAARLRRAYVTAAARARHAVRK